MNGRAIDSLLNFVARSYGHSALHGDERGLLCGLGDSICDGKIPAPGPLADDDRALLDQAYGLLDAVRKQMDVQAFHECLETLWVVVRAANGYVDRQAPWKLRKEDPARMGTVLYTLTETIRSLALLAQPFMPESSAHLLDQVGVAAGRRSFEAFGREHALKPDTTLPAPVPVFPRFVEKEGARSPG